MNAVTATEVAAYFDTLEAMDIPALGALVADAEAELAKRRQAERQRAEDAIRALAEKAGLSVTVSATVRGVAKGEAKYRNPVTGQSWSGRGRRPEWLISCLGRGLTLESLAV